MLLLAADGDRQVLAAHLAVQGAFTLGWAWRTGAVGAWRVGAAQLVVAVWVFATAGDLRHVGVSASFTAKRRAELVEELAPLVIDPGSAEFADHPWSSWYEAEAHETGQLPGAPNR